jgi:hypothetical protein
MKHMRIKKYADFFHDGAIWKIQNVKGKIQISMESAQVLQEWNRDNIDLSKRETISGKLSLEGIKSIKEDNNLSLEEFEIKDSYERARICDFEIKNNIVLLIICWIKYLPEYQESKAFQYEIEAEKIYWENIPTLFDDYWNSL